MNRRSFLSMIGLAPLAAVAAALPQEASSKAAAFRSVAGLSRYRVSAVNSEWLPMTISSDSLEFINSVPPGFASSFPGVNASAAVASPPEVASPAAVDAPLSISDGGLAAPRETEMEPLVTSALSPAKYAPLAGSPATVASLSSPRCEAAAVTNSDAGCALCGSLDCAWTHGPHAAFVLRASDMKHITSRTFAASEIAPKFSVSMDDVSTSSISVEE